MHDHVKIFSTVDPDRILAKDVIGSQPQFVRIGEREPYLKTAATLCFRFSKKCEGVEALTRSSLLIHEHDRGRRRGCGGEFRRFTPGIQRDFDRSAGNCGVRQTASLPVGRLDPARRCEADQRDPDQPATATKRFSALAHDVLPLADMVPQARNPGQIARTLTYFDV
jgi:hypothetical protein